jgi:hypothetical protein
MSKKPPKPLDRPASPRFKTRKREPTMGLKRVLDELGELTDSQPSHKYFTQWQEETNAERNHRGAAILLATNVENALQSVIIRVIEIKEGQRQKLFGPNAPLGSFSNKITLAYAMDLFGNETKTNLDIIRSIRNAFAHAKLPITFETGQVQRACEFLTIPTVLLRPVAIPKDDSKHLTGRKRFQRVCNDIAHNFLIVSLSGKFAVGASQLKFQLHPGIHLVALPLPLP